MGPALALEALEGAVERLGDAADRLEELRVEELAARAGFDISLHTLQHSWDPIDRAAVATFGLLSLLTG
jgi:hypothetical protein